MTMLILNWLAYIRSRKVYDIYKYKSINMSVSQNIYNILVTWGTIQQHLML